MVEAGVRGSGKRRRAKFDPYRWAISIPPRRSNVLCLGMSYACVRSQLKAAELPTSLQLLHPQECVEQAVELVRRNVLTEMDGRDLARCLALEASNETFAYTVSLEHGATYSARHLTANFNRPNFCREIKKRWGNKIKFRQIILDYFWIPSGSWAMTHWTRSFFYTTLPSFATEDLIDTSTGEGIIYLPFSLHCMTQVVAARNILRKYYYISYLYKDELSEHALWKATSSICSTTMQTWLGKAINQEDIYCTFNIRNVGSGAMDNGYTTKEDLMSVLNKIENVEQVRMIKLQVRKNWRRKGSHRSEEKKEDLLESNCGKNLENPFSLYTSKKLSNPMCQTNTPKISTAITEKLKIKNKTQRKLCASVKKQNSQTASSSKEVQTLHKKGKVKEDKYDRNESIERKCKNKYKQKTQAIDAHLPVLTTRRFDVQKAEKLEDDARISNDAGESAANNKCESYLRNTKRRKIRKVMMLSSCKNKKQENKKLEHLGLTYTFIKSKTGSINGRKQTHHVNNLTEKQRRVTTVSKSNKSSLLASNVIDRKKNVDSITYFCRPKIFWTGSSSFKHCVERMYPKINYNLESKESISHRIKEIVKNMKHEYTVPVHDVINKGHCEKNGNAPIHLSTNQSSVNNKTNLECKILTYNESASNEFNIDQLSMKKSETSPMWCISTKDGSKFQENVDDAAKTLLKLKCFKHKSITEKIADMQNDTAALSQGKSCDSRFVLKSQNSDEIYYRRKEDAADALAFLSKQEKMNLHSKSKKSTLIPPKKRTTKKCSVVSKKRSRKKEVCSKKKRRPKRKPIATDKCLDTIDKISAGPKEFFKSAHLFGAHESTNSSWTRAPPENIRDPFMENLIAMPPMSPYQPYYYQPQNETSLIPKLKLNLAAIRQYRDDLIRSYHRFCTDLYNEEYLRSQQHHNNFLQQPQFKNHGVDLNLGTDMMSRSQSTPFHS